MEPNRLRAMKDPGPSTEPSKRPSGPGGVGRLRDGIVEIVVVIGATLMVSLGADWLLGGVIPAVPSAAPEAPLPSFMRGGFPHEDAALEARLPQSVGDLELRTWSVRGAHVAEVQGESALPAVLELLGASIGDVSMAIAGRAATSDPPNWTFAIRIEGVTGDAIRDAFAAATASAAPAGERRTIEGVDVEVRSDGSTTGIVFAAGDAYVMVMAPLEEWAVEMVRRFDADPRE